MGVSSPMWGARSPSGHGGTGVPVRLAAHEVNQFRAAAQHAVRVFPGPVGELLARELGAHADFGYRFDGSGLLRSVAREVLAMPRTAEGTPPAPGR